MRLTLPQDSTQKRAQATARIIERSSSDCLLDHELMSMRPKARYTYHPTMGSSGLLVPSTALATIAEHDAPVESRFRLPSAAPVACPGNSRISPSGLTARIVCASWSDLG